MSEIQKMNYWRFRNVLKTLEKKICIENGKPYVEQGPLPQSTKDMIARRKAQR